jgi:8-amino-7-oxononanoate synthase
MWNNWFINKFDQIPNKRIRRTRINYDPRTLNDENKSLINFISNDYLGLAGNKDVINSAIKFIHLYGVGSTGAPSLSGYTNLHVKLAKKISEILDKESCLIFPSGYQLNTGLFSQLVDDKTIIWFDRRCHASHIDGILLSKAKFYSFLPSNLDNVFEKITNLSNFKHIILTEGTFSMDGTCEYLDKLITFKANNNNILLIIDDAHGIGALGKTGKGTLEQLNLNNYCFDIIIGTLGKAFGTHGGFICANKTTINYLEHSIRSGIFSTSLPPAIIGATISSTDIITSNLGQELRQKLEENIIFFKNICQEFNINLLNSSNQSPIQLVLLKNELKTSQITDLILQENLLVGKISYPTVKKNQARIRVSLNINHTKKDIYLLCQTIKKYINI